MNKEWRERLAAYDEEQLDDRERAALDLLLDSDPEARQYLADLRADRARFREALSTVQARPGFTAEVMARIEARQVPLWSRALAALRPRTMEVCAAGVMVLVGLAMVPRNAARSPQQACLDNLRTLGRNLLAYSDDWDHRLPDSTTWVAAVEQFRNRALTVTCPLDKRTSDGDRLVSYGMPAGLSGADVGKLPNPSSEMALRDAVGPFMDPRHDQNANAAFLDGHVATVSARR